VYLENVGLISALLLSLGMLCAAGTSILFQLPRIRGMRPAVGTFLGGMSIGGAVILWVLAGVFAGGELIHEILVFALMGAEIALAFFAVGFLILALYPPGMEGQAQSAAVSPKARKNKEEKKSATDKDRGLKEELEDDIFERL
jgi:uncharacterized membrane protein